MKNDRVWIHTGTTTLVMMIAVLALVIFSVLSLSSANVYRKMTMRIQDRQTEYYEAEEQASRILNDVACRIKGDNTEFLQDSSAAMQKLSRDIPEVSAKDEGLSWSVPCGEDQILMVEIEPVLERSEKLPYRITKWQIVDTAEWRVESSKKYLS